MSRGMTCSLNGIDPEQLDPRLLVTDILEEAPQVSRTVSALAMGDGSLVTGEQRLCLTVVLRVLIRERHREARAQLLEQLAIWCRGSLLEVSSRPDRCLWVRCEEYPLQQSRDWTEPVTIRLCARQPPWWQERQPRALRFMEEGRSYVPGCGVPCPVSWRVTNTGDAPITRLTLTCGDTSQTLEELLLSPGEAVAGEAEGGILTLRGSGDALPRLTGTSDDLLTVDCGGPWVMHVQADGLVSVEARTRGRFM